MTFQCVVLDLLISVINASFFKQLSNLQFDSWAFHTYAGVPLEPTLQLTPQHLGQLEKSGVGDENPEKARKIFWLMPSPRQDIVHHILSGSTSQPDLG